MIRKTNNHLNITDDNLKLKYTLLYYNKEERLKFHIYKYKNIHFSIQIKIRCSCDSEVILLNNNESNLDDKLLRFTTIYDRIYNKYLLIYENIILYRYIEDGFKFHKIYTLDFILYTDIKIIPIYDEKDLINMRDFKREIEENGRLLDENAHIMDEQKYRNIINIIDSIKDNLVNDYSTYNLDTIFMTLSNINNQIKNKTNIL